MTNEVDNGLGPIDKVERLDDKQPPPKKSVNLAEGTNLTGEFLLKLIQLGIVYKEGVRNHNVGKSDYAKHIIQPWAIWLDYGLNPWDADLIKRTLRDKEGESRVMDYEKMIHICQERITQIRSGLK